jgi:hypothetical protein
VEVATLPDGADPADLLAAHGPGVALRVILDRVQPAVVAHLSRILDRLLARPLDLAEPETRVLVWRAITPCFRSAPGLAADLAALAASRLKLPLAEVMTGVVNQIGLPPDQPVPAQRAHRRRTTPKPGRIRSLRSVPTIPPSPYARALEAFRSASWRRAA